MNREEDIQIACVEWFKLQYGNRNKDWKLIKIHNEGKKTIGRAVKDKRMGLTAGVSDLFLAVPSNGYHGLWVECKAPDGDLSAGQVAFMVGQRRLGYQCAAVWSVREFQELINEYLKPVTK